MTYSSEDLLPLSGLQHFAFCRRQWALIHLEQQWQENLRTVEGDLFEQTLADGDILLLCSDGLTGMVEDGKIAEVLAGAGTLEDKGRELLTLALEGGGRDNITVALFTCGAKQEA